MVHELENHTLTALLKRVANYQNNIGVIAYPSGMTTNGSRLSYTQLLSQAEHSAKAITALPGFQPTAIVLVHLDDHLDNMTIFWSVVIAGGVPCMSTPFAKIPEQRVKHIQHLRDLLHDPICITRSHLMHQFSGQDLVKPYTIEELSGLQASHNATKAPNSALTEPDHRTHKAYPYHRVEPDDLALLMLTSGSTGNAKAVRLTHTQIITAIASKCEVRALPIGSPFLNWIGFDHVACVTEIHLQAMYLGVDQVHVQAADIISSPELFLRLLSEHRVGKTFAPNFYLAQIRKYLQTKGDGLFGENIDLSNLHWFSTGGEPNVVETCQSLAKALSQLGAPANVIVPGFGMTEICAGSIWNVCCPRYDILNGFQFASLGTCMPGIEMRIVYDTANISAIAPTGHQGFLEVRGPIVFKGYYNNDAATSKSINSDGWFRTGDRAMIDAAGNLNLIGRNDDYMNINGVKYLPSELQEAIEACSIDGVTPGYTVCFSFRPPDSQTEQVCVVYLPSYAADDVNTRALARKEIIKATMLQTGSQPQVLPLDSSTLMSTLR